MTPAERQPHPPHPTTGQTADVAGRFRAAVEASSPVFSPGLHARVIRCVRTERAQSAARSTGMPARSHPWRFALLTTAAAVAVAAGVTIAILLAAPRPRPNVVQDPGSQGTQTHPTTRSRVALLPPTLADAVAYVTPVKDRVDHAQRELINRGADRLHHYCLEQLRIFPAHPQRDAAEERTDRADSAPVAG